MFAKSSRSISTKASTSFALLALLLGALFRSLPVLLAWPYPLGYDTTAYYLIQMTSVAPTPYHLFSEEALHAAILSPLYHLAPSASSAFIALNGFAICLQAVLSFEIYAYARRVAKLEPKFAFVASFAFTFNLITMRLLWDQYRIDLGLIFVLLIFILFSSKKSYFQWLGVPLMLAVFLSNAEPATLVVLTLIIFAGVSLFSPSRVENAFKISLRSPLLWAALLGIILEASELAIFSRATTGLPPNLLSESVGPAVSATGVLYLIYVAWPLLLFVPLGLRENKMNYHTIWFFLVLLIAIVLPFLGNAFVFEPITWLYWITSFPLSIFFGSALQNYTNTEASRHKILTVKRFKNLLVLVLCILVILSIAYSVTSPLASDPYSLLGAPFASSQPLGYLQSTVPTSQEANLVSVLSTALTALPSNSTIYLGEQFYGLSLVLPNPHSLQLKPVGLIDSESNLSSLASYGTGFTVWWTEANGWYGVNSIPNNFTPMITVDAFSLYRI